MSYEKHLQSLEQKLRAEENLKAAQELLLKAQAEYDQAIANYQKILDEASKEVTPELIKEAYGEYKQILMEKAQKELLRGNFEEAEKLCKELSLLEKNYGDSTKKDDLEKKDEEKTKRAGEEGDDEFIEEVKDIIRGSGIKREEEDWWLKRAKHISKTKGYPREKILDILQGEIKKEMGQNKSKDFKLKHEDPGYDWIGPHNKD